MQDYVRGGKKQKKKSQNQTLAVLESAEPSGVTIMFRVQICNLDAHAVWSP